MPIKNLWLYYKLECLEAFLQRAFEVNDKYTKTVTPPESDAELGQYTKTLGELHHAFGILLGYQDIVFRAVHLES